MIPDALLLLEKENSGVNDPSIRTVWKLRGMTPMLAVGTGVCHSYLAARRLLTSARVLKPSVSDSLRVVVSFFGLRGLGVIASI